MYETARPSRLLSLLTALLLIVFAGRSLAGTGSQPCRIGASELYEAVSPAVVMISAMSMSARTGGDQMARSAGTGVLVDPSGLIVTNSHVVFGHQIVTVTLDDGSTLPARIVGADPVFDIAAIRVPKPEKGTLPVAPLGVSEALLVGDEVYAIGNPFGLEQTLTRGIVSAVNRILPGPSWSLKEPMIQTDAAINHGSSGGPIIDSCGKVVGIATAILPEAQNIGFAIPIDLVKKVLPDLVEKGRVIRPWLGVQGQLIPPQFKSLLRLPLTDGFLVEVVEPGSPAALQRVSGGDLDVAIGGTQLLVGGDIITEIDGKQLTEPEKLAETFASLKAGDTIELTLYRDEKKRKVRVTLAERPILPHDFPAGASLEPAGGLPSTCPRGRKQCRQSL